jgi:PAS domain S-box-containing protein
MSTALRVNTADVTSPTVGALISLARDLPGGVLLVVDTEARIVVAEGRGVGDLRRGTEQLVGRKLASAFAPADRLVFERATRVALRGDPEEMVAEAPNRSTMIRAWPLVDETGRVTAGVVLAHDAIEPELSAERQRALLERAGELERQRRTVGESAGVISYRLDAVTGEFLGVGPGVAELLGYDDSEFPGDWVSHIHPDDRGLVVNELRAAVRDGIPFRREYRMVRADGSIAWVLDTSALEPGDGERAPARFGVVADVTERVRAERELREVESRFRLLVEQLPAVTYIDDAAGRPLYVSPQVETMIGSSVDAWMSDSRHWLTLVHPDDVDRADSGYQRLRSEGASFRDSYRLVTADGRTLWIDDYAVCLRAADGSRLRAQGVMFDVTAQKRAELEAAGRAEQQAAVARLGMHALSPAGPAAVMHELAGAVLETLHTQGVSVVELVQDGTAGIVRAVAGSQSAAVGGTLDATPGSLLCAALVAERGMVIADTHEEPRYRLPPELGLTEPRSLAAVRVRLRDGLWGVVVSWSDLPREFTEDDIDFLQAMAHVLGAAVERERAAAALAASEARRRDVYAEMLRAGDAERNRIAVELHDDSIQVMTATLLSLDRLEHAIPAGDGGRMSDAVRAARGTLAQATERTRRLMFELRPQLLEAQGLPAALRALVAGIAAESGLVAEVSADVGRYPEALEGLVYRTVHELVTNVRKHAAAAHLWITVVELAGWLDVTVADDGAGFDPVAIGARDRSHLHIGLDSAAERVRLGGGNFRLDSAPQMGTLVHFRMPLA